MSGPQLSLDHLVIAVHDLAAAQANYTRLLGRRPSWRGDHPTYGSANVLYRLDNTYVELLALGAGDSPWSRTLRGHLERRGEGLYAIAIASADLEATVAAARARGLGVADPAPGDGVDEITGAKREWRNARIDPATARGVYAFFIQHDSPPDALPLAEPIAQRGVVTGVDHTVLVSPDLDAALGVWRDAVGLDLRRTVDWPPQREAGQPVERRLCFLRLGGTILELTGRPGASAGPAQGAAEDRLWGVSYRVDDVAAHVERLRAEGVTVSDARTGRADGTLVADLKPGFSHEVRTLFLQKTAPHAPAKETP